MLALLGWLLTDMLGFVAGCLTLLAIVYLC